jgi:glycerol-3-phosphate acyltransferase PlsY
MNPLLVLIISYLIGSLPTALIVSRLLAKVDIREIGDGNMGARNVTRTLGWGPGIFVAIIDFCKGGSAILVSRSFDMNMGWQLAAGFSAVLGHDFPIWARFRGGQGMAAILGMLFLLIPTQTCWGLLIFFLAYLLTRNFDLSASVGLGCLAFLTWHYKVNYLILYFTVALFLSIPIKKALDWPRRKRLRDSAKEADKTLGCFSNDVDEAIKDALPH